MQFLPASCVVSAGFFFARWSSSPSPLRLPVSHDFLALTEELFAVSSDSVGTRVPGVGEPGSSRTLGRGIPCMRLPDDTCLWVIFICILYNAEHVPGT